MNLQDVSDAFDIQASPEPLSGGSRGEKLEHIHPAKWRNVHLTASRSSTVSAGRPPDGVLRRASRAQRRLHSPG